MKPMPATRRFRDVDQLPDESRYEMIAWDVPASAEYPEGIKYGFQYMTKDGQTLLRYDNYTDTHGDRHHRHHYEDGISALDFDTLDDLIEEFYEEVNQIHDERN
jgi:hypothetical protein